MFSHHERRLCHSETTQSPHLHSTCPRIDSRLAAALLEDLSYLYRSLEGVSTFLHLQRCREPSAVAQPHAPHVDRFMGRPPPNYVALENKPVMQNKLAVIIACMFTTPMQICCFCLCLLCCSFFLLAPVFTAALLSLCCQPFPPCPVKGSAKTDEV